MIPEVLVFFISLNGIERSTDEGTLILAVNSRIGERRGISIKNFLLFIIKYWICEMRAMESPYCNEQLIINRNLGFSCVDN